MKSKLKNTAIILFIIYSIIMIWLLFGQRMDHWTFDSYRERLMSNYNLVPFGTIKDFIKVLNRSFYFINLAGNVIMFIPLGFFLPVTLNKFRAFWKTVLLSLVVLLCVETIQLFTLLGSWDIDDIILNLSGVAIGYLFYYIISKLIRTRLAIRN
jgi:glycopeptide antibiotics resistance protein